ncbi:hypothetical protein RUND412_004843 [Rhizina undulata]
MLGIREDFEEFEVPVKLPFPQNPNFCGRDDILEEMHKALDPCPNTRGSNPKRKTVVLYGMGGVRKSQIALEYAYRFRHCYTSIFWIDADNISLTNDSAFQAVEQLKDHYETKWRSSPDFQEIAHTLHISIDGSSRIDPTWKTVKDLGELPLALDQAGAYVSELQLTFSAFRERMNDAFNEEPLDPSLPLERASIRTTWEISFKELSADARYLLHLCSFLSNEDIPDELFRRGKRAVPWILEGENKLDKAIRSLFTFSFAKREDSGDSFLDTPAFASVIVKDEHMRRTEDWVFERRILNHLKVCEEHISEFFSDMDSVNAAQGLSSIASAYQYLGSHKQAEELCQRAITAYEMALGKDHPSSLDTLYCMGSILESQNRYDEALEFFGRALSRKEKAFGRDDLSTLCAVNDMMLVFSRKEQHDEALELHYRALALREKALGNDHRETLETVHNIALVFYNQERYEEALDS